MSYNGSGTFNINSTGQPVVAGTVITASAFNALTADLATGLTTAITKDGQTTTTAQIPFAQGLRSTLVTDSSSVSTGSIITDGGMGVAKNLYVGGTLNVTGSTSLTNPVINNIKMGYSTTATAGGSTSLTVSSNYRQFFTGSTTQTIVLPVTSTLVTGIAYEIENNSTGLLTVNSSGGNLVGTIPAGVCAHAVCIGTTLTTAADWDWDYISTTTITGTGANVLGTSPTITTPTISSLSSAAATALTLQSAGTTAVTIDTSQNVGIGITTPQQTLHVNNSSSPRIKLTNATTGTGSTDGSEISIFDADTSLRIINRESANILFGTADTERMRINSSGNVGIGTTSPNARLNVSDSADGAQSGTIRLGDNGTYYGENLFRYNSSEYRIGVYPSGNMTFYTKGSESARITSSGQVFVNTTSTLNGTLENFQLYPVTSGAFQYGMMIAGNANTYTAYAMRFLNSYTPAVVGSIVINNTTTSFNTNSDYRLKENIAPMTGALAKVAKLKPVTYKWKQDGSNGEGFIAHELAEVVPQAVTGQKDAVEEDGTPHYQGIDTSFLVATLTAAIQELKAINDTQAETINALTARVTALENA